MQETRAQNVFCVHFKEWSQIETCLEHFLEERVLLETRNSIFKVESKLDEPNALVYAASSEKVIDFHENVKNVGESATFWSISGSRWQQPQTKKWSVARGRGSGITNLIFA